MRYLLFNWEEIPDIIDNPKDLSNMEFEQLAKNHGLIYENDQDFEHDFNASKFSTETHQLRIVSTRKK